jgi:DNA-binding MarR family transcriptional regulator
LRRISRAVDLHSRLLLQRYGLTAPQLAALRAIGRMQPVTAGALARQIHLSQATVTGILSRLEKRGLVQRARGHRDRRSVFVQLTGEGTAIIEQAPPMLQERFAKRLAELEQWERTMILATLQRIAAMMDVEDVAAERKLISAFNDAADERPAMPIPIDEAMLAENETAQTEDPQFCPEPDHSSGEEHLPLDGIETTEGETP